MMLRDVTYAIFNKVDSAEYFTYSITKVNKAPDCPGIYGWYIYVPINDDEAAYHQVFKERELDVEAYGSLKEEYKGTLSLESLDLRKVRNERFLSEVTKLFCPPIYIGITEDQNLDERLTQHRKAINEVVFHGDRGDKNEFADRVGEKIRETDGISINSLYARVYPVDSREKLKGLNLIESFLNRTYVPFYGER